jgi:hypothetical protein
VKKVRLLAVLAIVGFFPLLGTAPAQSQTQDVNEIVFESTSSDGKWAPVRRGYWSNPAGFGADKIFWKHKIDNFNLIASTHMAPPNQDGPSSYHYLQTVGRTRCDWTIGPFGDCEVYEEDILRLVVDYRTDDPNIPTEPRTKGVITMYCTARGPQFTECEPWVNTTIDYPPQGPWPF